MYLQGLISRPEGNTLLAKRGRNWEYNSKMDFQEVWWGVMEWIDLA